MPTKINDKPINNAHHYMRIRVTQEDIAKGNRKDETSCAAAQCILRSVPGVDAVKVFRGVTYLRQNGVWKRYRTSSALRLETIVWDRGGVFVGGEYDLLPVPLSQLVAKVKRVRGSSPKSNRPRHRPPRRTVIPGLRPTANGHTEQPKKKE